MQLQTIVYVTDMDASLAWYSQLLERSPTAMSEHWSTFAMGGATLALHATDQAQSPGNVAVSLVADGPLEDCHGRVAAASVIITQPFGRSFVVTDPDGAEIQVNEHG